MPFCSVLRRRQRQCIHARVANSSVLPRVILVYIVLICCLPYFFIPGLFDSQQTNVIMRVCGDIYMITATAAAFRRDLYNFLERAARLMSPVAVPPKHGNAVILSEDEYMDIAETLFSLLSPA